MQDMSNLQNRAQPTDTQSEGHCMTHEMFDTLYRQIKDNPDSVKDMQPYVKEAMLASMDYTRMALIAVGDPWFVLLARLSSKGRAEMQAKVQWMIDKLTDA